MANIIKNILNGLNLSEDEDDFEDDGYDWEEKTSKRGRRVVEASDNDDEDEDETPKRKLFGKKDDDSDLFNDDDESEQKQVRQSKKNYGKVVHMKSIQGGAGKMELRVIRPKTYEDSREICLRPNYY